MNYKQLPNGYWKNNKNRCFIEAEKYNKISHKKKRTLCIWCCNKKMDGMMNLKIFTMKKNKIIVVFSSHLGGEENDKFIKHINNTIGVKHEVVCYENYNEFSLTEIYNKALNKYSEENTIMVFCHPDILFRTKNWGKILLTNFNNSNFDVIGVAGTTFLNNGVWWTDRTKMVGIVDHTDGFREWSSEYSSERKGVIIPTVLIDGLFMAVNPEKLQHHFDEDFKGFHFYDLSFCVPNYLDGCNIGVTTDIRILHKSIGVTNEKWEENRNLFVKKYIDDLPIKHISDNKLKVLICCQFFKNLTGSEIVVFEYACELVKLGCDVSVVSTLIGEPLMSKAIKAGVKVYGLTNAPNYTVGDDNKLVYLRNEIDFDILHINHKPIGELILQMYQNTPAVMHLHSEIIPIYEEPIIHPAIKKYISIREGVTNHIKSYNINENMIVEISNPFDFSRFNTNYKQVKNDKEVVLFIGTHDYLRKAMLFDLVEKTKENNQDLWLIGKHDIYVDELIKNEHVKYFGVVADVENYIKKCDYTAGILVGRTTIEGFLCGKPAIIYNVDKHGNILNIEKKNVPNTEELKKYSKEFATYEVFKIYNKIIVNEKK